MWSTVSYKSSVGQGKFAGQRTAFYHCATQPTNESRLKCKLKITVVVFIDLFVIKLSVTIFVYLYVVGVICRTMDSCN